MKKNCEISEDFQSFCLHTQNLVRFIMFAIVVVTFFDEILNDFHDFVFGMCFPKENQQPILGVTVFMRKVPIFIRRETKTHILPTKINEQQIR